MCVYDNAMITHRVCVCVCVCVCMCVCVYVCVYDLINTGESATTEKAI